MNLDKITALDHEYLFQNYGNRFPVSFEKAEDLHLIDTNGKRYVDFLSGISVTNIGSKNPAFISALHAQIDKIVHSSNFFFNETQALAAQKISDLSFKGRTLFVNSGTEANEAAIKLARRYGQAKSTECYNIIAFDKSFHGRTFGAMSATGNTKINSGFGPLVPGFIHLPYNDVEAFKNAIKEKQVCAVMLELIQGEGGINVIDEEFCKEIAQLAKKNDILLIVDEIQTGIGRTGTYFVYQHFAIEPDILTLAKGLGNGIPIGALHTKESLVSLLPAGTHGTTFGGNHLATAAACAVLDVIKNDKVLENVSKMSTLAFTILKEIESKTDIIKEIRGVGLHIGVELTVEGLPLVKEALSEGLIINCTAGNVLRIMPPLVIDEKTLREGLSIFETVLSKYKA